MIVITRCTLVMILTFLITLIWYWHVFMPFYDLHKIHTNQHQKVKETPAPDAIVNNFGVSITIPDLPNKHAEGGFHLYFTSPNLNIRQLLAYSFDKESRITGHFNLQSRNLVTYHQFLDALSQMTLTSQSNNIYNASHIAIYGTLSNGQTFYGEKQLDPEIDRDQNTGHIGFNNIILNLK